MKPKRILDKYDVLNQIGKGGMGSVYLVQDIEGKQKFAAKIIESMGKNSADMKRLRREFRALKSLDSPSIVKVMELADLDNGCCYIMEFVPGITLKKFIHNNFKLTENWIKTALKLMGAICEPLNYIHHQRFIHRDLKPSNIMVIPTEQNLPVKLLDFGLVRHLDTHETVTQLQTIIGSLIYMSPEQARGTDLDNRADIYSLGIIFYELLTGEPPFNANHPVTLLGMHQFREPEMLTQKNPIIPNALQALVLKMLEKDPSHRPASARDVLDSLNRIAGPGLSIDLSAYLAKPHKPYLEPVFCGRVEELDGIAREFDLSRKFGLRVLSITGESGVGKSRLLNQISRLPHLQNSTIISSKFSENYQRFSDVLDHAIRDKLEQVIRFGTVETTRQMPLQQIKNLLRTTFSDTQNNHAKEVQISVSDLYDKLTLLASGWPIILIMDDSHLAGDEDFKLIENLFLEHIISSDQENRPESMFLILAARTEHLESGEPLETFRSRMRSVDRLADLKMKPLEKSDIEKMVVSMLGGPADNRMVDAVAMESGGNPLFVYEMIKHGVASERFTRSRSRWGMTEKNVKILPERITKMILRRLETLTPDQQELLNIAAVAGEEFESDLIEAVLSKPDEIYLDILGELIRRKYIFEIPQRWDRLRFAHSRLRNVILLNIPQEDRITISLKTAKWLVNNRACDPGRIAGLFEDGNQFDTAYRYRWKAFELCMNDELQADALVHLQRADTDSEKCSWTDMKRLEETQKLYLEKGRLERRLGKLDDGRLHLIKSHRIAIQRKDLSGQGMSLLHLGSLYGQQRTVKSAEAVLHKAVDIFNQLNEKELLVDAYSNLGAATAQAGRHDDSLQYHQKAFQTCRQLDEDKRKIRCMINLGMILTTLERFQEALDIYRDALILARQKKENRMIAFCLSGIATLHIAMGLDRKTAHQTAEIAREAVSIMVRTGDKVLLADCLFKLARARKYLHQPHRHAFDKAFQIARELGINSLLTLLETWQSHAEGGK